MYSNEFIHDSVGQHWDCFQDFIIMMLQLRFLKIHICLLLQIFMPDRFLEDLLSQKDTCIFGKCCQIAEKWGPLTLPLYTDIWQCCLPAIPPRANLITLAKLISRKLTYIWLVRSSFCSCTSSSFGFFLRSLSFPYELGCLSFACWELGASPEVAVLNPLVMFVASIFPRSVVCHVILFMDSFVTQRFWIMKSHVPIVSFTGKLTFLIFFQYNSLVP